MFTRSTTGINETCLQELRPDMRTPVRDHECLRYARCAGCLLDLGYPSEGPRTSPVPTACFIDYLPLRVLPHNWSGLQSPPQPVFPVLVPALVRQGNEAQQSTVRQPTALTRNTAVTAVTCPGSHCTLTLTLHHSPPLHLHWCPSTYHHQLHPSRANAALRSHHVQPRLTWILKTPTSIDWSPL